MKARGAAWILGGLMLAVFALIVLLSTQSGGASEAISPHAISDATPSSEPASTDRDALVHGDLAADASRSERASAAESTAHSAPKRLRFHYANGEPAAGLELCRADWRTQQVEHGLDLLPPQWSHRLDAHGELDATLAGDLGALVAVRLNRDCIEIFPFDASQSSDRELTPTIEQEFRLANAPSGREFTTEIHIGNADFRRCTGAFNPDAFHYQTDRVEAFADAVSARSWTDEHLVIAYRRLRVSSSRSTVVKLPPGDYWVECASSTVGAWMNATSVHVDGTPIHLPLTSVPITQALLKRDEKGALRIPERITVFTVTATEPAKSATLTETDLDFEVDGERLLISERCSNAAVMQDAKYALRFYWPDGTTTNTAPGQWENLLDTVALCGQ